MQTPKRTTATSRQQNISEGRVRLQPLVGEAWPEGITQIKIKTVATRDQEARVGLIYLLCGAGVALAAAIAVYAMVIRNQKLLELLLYGIFTLLALTLLWAMGAHWTDVKALMEKWTRPKKE
jgi:hypothetical protein